MTKTILVNTSTTNGRVYCSGLFMRLCEQTSMEVSQKKMGVSYTGGINEMALGDKIVADYAKENGNPP